MSETVPPAPASPAAAPAIAPGTSAAPAASGAAPTAPVAAQAAPTAPVAAQAAPGALLTSPAADPAKPADPAAPAVVEYTDFALPEGVTADAEGLTAARAEFAKMGLSQEHAQALVSLYAGRVAAQSAAAAAAAGEARAAERHAIVEAVRADPEIGGPKFDSSIAHASKALARFGSPALMEALTKANADNHPEVIRMFARVGAALNESGFVPGGPAGGGGKPAQPATTLYPNSKHS